MSASSNHAIQNLVVLGATGTVGRNTLAVAALHPDKLRVLALTANRDVDGLFQLCVEFKPEYAVMVEAVAAQTLRERLSKTELKIEVMAGTQALAQIAAHEQADQVMSAIVGAAGLLPTLAAVSAGKPKNKKVLIANKEPLVMGGALLMAAAARSGAQLIPIDSEHNAIFQCLPAGARCGSAPKGVRRLILTASGGPFRETPAAELAQVTPQQAVRHPNWVMGPKISVDSASMMNKGLELIEAAVLYGLAETQLEVVIHPESVIHSLVEYVDGSLLAQLSQPDMRVPIAHALAYPQRWESGVSGLDLAALGQFRFAAPDTGRFPCLRLAREALRAGGHLPNVLNASNEVAVEAFLNHRLGFKGIPDLIEYCLEAAQGADLPAANELEGILGVDAWARATAHTWLAGGHKRVAHA